MGELKRIELSTSMGRDCVVFGPRYGRVEMWFLLKSRHIGGYVIPHSNTDTEPEEEDDDTARMHRPSQVSKPKRTLTQSAAVQAGVEFSLLYL